MERKAIPRWQATITYMIGRRPEQRIHEFEEMEELHMLVEQGPDWNFIVDFRIDLLRRQY
ncbi:hypothetical protein [Paracoccus methylarcula]|uniref:Uncharacterized protein n=1 Tax=Paracoccus methylarcula TaxID=72022 RepID=A0A3R7N9W5_9RHOB|nr:hypothetical protein [Paracoccus methylarcula]RNF32928.1 hypothetical protein A7A09_019130 [Paracoccus methylarcula]